MGKDLRMLNTAYEKDGYIFEVDGSKDKGGILFANVLRTLVENNIEDALIRTKDICIIHKVDKGQDKDINALLEKLEQHRAKTESIDKYDLVGDCIDMVKEFLGVEDELEYREVEI